MKAKERFSKLPERKLSEPKLPEWKLPQPKLPKWKLPEPLLVDDKVELAAKACMKPPEPPSARKITNRMRSKAENSNADKEDPDNPPAKKKYSFRMTERRMSMNQLTITPVKRPRGSYTSDEPTRMPSPNIDLDAQFESLRAGPLSFQGQISQDAQILHKKLASELKAWKELGDDESTNFSPY